MEQLAGMYPGVPTQELLERIQIISLDRGGRLLTSGLMLQEPFSRMLSDRPSTAFRRIKIDTETISQQNIPIEGYDFAQYQRLKSILENQP